MDILNYIFEFILGLSTMVLVIIGFPWLLKTIANLLPSTPKEKRKAEEKRRKNYDDSDLPF